MEKCFMMQIKRTNGTYEKGVVVKDTIDAAKQSFHAYFGAYGYGHDENTDYVFCSVDLDDGRTILREIDDRRSTAPVEE